MCEYHLPPLRQDIRVAFSGGESRVGGFLEEKRKVLTTVGKQNRRHQQELPRTIPKPLAVP